MLVPLAILIPVVIALIAAGWVAWHHLMLRRGISDYARMLRGEPRVDIPRGSPELEDLISALRAVTSAFDVQLADLRHERDRLAAILDQMTDGVLIADRDGRVRLANPAARRFFATSEPLGRSIAEVLRDDRLIEVWRRCQQTGELQSESVELPLRQQYFQLVAIPDRQGEGSLLLVQDLTRVRRLETVRQDFVSNISHELRTPLASLKALTETLRDGALNDAEAGPRFLDGMVTEVDALTQMAQELLDLSRIESGQVLLELSTVAPQKLLASAAERMKMQAERAGLVLRMECREDLPVLRADASRIEQVLVNLIHNAVKFTRPGGEVVLTADLVQAPALGTSDGVEVPAIRFAVRDTGVGIPSDQVPRVFERFYRVDKARSGGGTGLGLSIARHVVEAHGGRIWVESIEGHGSTFFFLIPKAP